MSKYYVPQKPSTVASEYLARQQSYALNAYYSNQVQQSNSYSSTSNVTNTLSPQGIQKVLSDAAKAWEEVQKLNEQIDSTEDESMNYSVACGRVVHN